MERTGAAVPSVVTTELVEVAGARGKFLSVYLTTEIAVENAAQLAERRWKAARRELSGKGADERNLLAVDELVADAHLEGAALGVVLSTDGARGVRGAGARAAGAGARFVDHDVDPLQRDLVGWGPAPVLTPAIAWRQRDVPYVCVLADRTGADLLAVSRDEPPESASAGGDQWPTSKTHGGGRARWRFEHRVEENWARNERQVAGELERLVDTLGARLVALAGDERAVGILRASVPSRIGELTVTVTGSRATESAHDGLGDDVARWVHTVASRETVEALEALHGRMGSDGAVEGSEATLAALREARVDVLLVHDDRLTSWPEPDGDDGSGARTGARTAWFDPTTPELCAARRSELTDLGVERPSEASFADVAVRAALLSGAGVRLVPVHGGPAEGVGALLRWRA